MGSDAVCSTRKHSLENSLMRASNRLNRLQWVRLETRDTLIDGYKSKSLLFHYRSSWDGAENRILGIIPSIQVDIDNVSY